jgi:uncharacterized cupredoxin-like copper-binding protein
VPTLAFLTLGAVACSDDTSSPEGSGTAGAKTVATTITDSSLTLSPSSSEAGETTFEVSNSGGQIHELEIFEGDVAHDALPVENNVAKTDGLELVDEVEDIAPSTTAELTVDLEPGNYVIVCNLPGHYEAGLHSGFTIS